MMSGQAREVVLVYYGMEELSSAVLARVLRVELERRGWSVTMRPMKQSTKEDYYVEDDGKPVVTFMERRVANLMVHQSRYRPAGLLSVAIDNWEGMDAPNGLRYLSIFFGDVYGDVPVRHVSPTEKSLGDVLALAGEYLNAETFGRFKQRASVLEYGMEDKFFPGDNDPDRLVVPYTQFREPQKRVREHHDLTTRYHAWAASRGLVARTDFYMTRQSQSMFGRSGLDESVYQVLPVFMDRDEYAAALRGYGMFLSTSAFESFGLFYLELLLSGVVGIFKDRDWVRRLLPGYRFTVPRDRLLDTMIWVRQNYEEAAPYVRGRYGMGRYVDEIEAILNGFLLGGER